MIPLALFLAAGALSQAATPLPAELAEAAAWAAAKFERVEQAAPYAFDTAPFFGMPDFARADAGWVVQKTKRSIDTTRTGYTIVYRDPATGLVVRCEGVAYSDFPTVEWTLFFKNEGTAPVPLKDVLAINAGFRKEAGKKFVLYHHSGDNCTADSYEPHVTELVPTEKLRLGNTGGRPTQITFPYFNVSAGNKGVIFVVAWPGQWFAEFTRDSGEGLTLAAGQDQVQLELQPGEEIRTPLVVLQFWHGEGEAGRVRAQNVWRAWMIAHNIPRPGGKLPPLPQLAACSSHQFGEMINADSESQKFFVSKYLERGFKLDYWWMDAGWYWCDGQWPKTGTWEVDTNRFPGGLRPISDFALERGVHTLVWFEPERVHSGTWLADQRPQWVHGGKDGGLLDLGNPEARAWLTEHIDGLLNSEGIHLYRQDFNIDPLEFWRKNDAPNRHGITEIRHVEGYLEYWDELRRRHPDMLIDSCASGGRRNDLETLRRAVPLLRSDYIMEPVGNQCHTWALAQWFPFYGTGTSKTDPYLILSTLCPSFTACWDMRDAAIDYEGIRRIIDQWTEVAPCYFGDYYPLTPYSLAEDQWIAWQFDLPGEGKGFVQAFRRGGCEGESIRLKLQGLDGEKSYALCDAGQPEQVKTYSGAELATGFDLAIAQKPGAAIWKYKVVDKKGT